MFRSLRLSNATNMLFPHSSNHPSIRLHTSSHNADARCTMPIFRQFYVSVQRAPTVNPAAQHATLSRPKLMDPPRQPLAHALLDGGRVLVSARTAFRYCRLVGLIVDHNLGWYPLQ